MLNLTNQKFHRLTAIKPVGRNRNRVVIWRFVCDCGKIKDIDGTKVRLGLTKSCGCLKAENLKKDGKEHHNWQGYGDISLSFFNRMKSSAKLRKHSWNLSPQFLWKLYLKQNKRCALSGIEIKMPFHIRQLRDKANDTLASLDRIDSNRGYERDNVQWICKRINYMKHTQNQEKFLNLVKAIYEKRFKN